MSGDDLVRVPVIVHYMPVGTRTTFADILAAISAFLFSHLHQLLARISGRIQRLARPLVSFLVGFAAATKRTR